MPTALPPSTDYSDPGRTEGQCKQFITDVRAFLAGLLGTDGVLATARTQLGLGSIATQAAGAVAITGGAIDGTPIGATTPSTVKGTTGTFTGLLDLSGASAGQVSFPAAQNASAGANVLDDYEEGSFTPSWNGLIVTNGTGGATHYGFYTKIGREVFWVAIIALTGTATTQLTASGGPNNLPFTPKNPGGNNHGGAILVSANPVQVHDVGSVNGTVVSFNAWAAGNGYDMSASGTFQI